MMGTVHMTWYDPKWPLPRLVKFFARYWWRLACAKVHNRLTRPARRLFAYRIHRMTRHPSVLQSHTRFLKDRTVVEVDRGEGLVVVLDAPISRWRRVAPECRLYRVEPENSRRQFPFHVQSWEM